MASEKMKGSTSLTENHFNSAPQQMTLFQEENPVVTIKHMKMNTLFNAFIQNANSVLKVERKG